MKRCGDGTVAASSLIEIDEVRDGPLEKAVPCIEERDERDVTTRKRDRRPAVERRPRHRLDLLPDAELTLVLVVLRRRARAGLRLA